MVARWRLLDSDFDETYTFPLNPNKMTGPFAPRKLTVVATAPSSGATNTQGRVIEGHQEPYEWQFSGAIRTQEQHDELVYWCRKVNRLILTDHFGRQWYIRMVGFDPEEKRPTANRPWRFDYIVKALNYGPVA